MLAKLEWPGNIRELEHALHRAVILAKNDTISPKDLVPKLNSDEDRQPGEANFPSLEEYERQYIRRVLKHTNGRINGPEGAAAVLGMHPNTLRSRMKKLGIKRNEA